MARLVTLQVFLEPTDALVVRSLLEAQGFYIHLPDDICRLDWLHAPAYGGVRVQVLDVELDSVVSFLSDAGWLDSKASDMGMPFNRTHGVFGPFGLALMIVCMAFGAPLYGFALLVLRNRRVEPSPPGI
jgi:hypothetical protein